MFLFFWICAGAIVAAWAGELVTKYVSKASLSQVASIGLAFVGGLTAYTILVKVFPEWLS